MRRAARGATVVEALVAAALAGVALAALAATTALARRALVTARDASTALVVAADRLETLRAGARGAGGDVLTAPGGTVFTRTWTVVGGRGRPAELRTRVVWAGRVLDRATEVWP